MAKKATTKDGSKHSKNKAIAERHSSEDGESGSRSAKDGMGEAFIKLLQSPLVAELVAVAATAALAALAEHGFTTGSETTRGKRTGKAVKEAGKAAAAAVGRRLANEIDEIRKAATDSQSGAKG